MPTVPLAVPELAITGVPALTVRVKVPVPVPVALVALTAIDDVPDALGVPEINPVDVLIDNPAGKLVAPKLVGEFVAAI